MKEAIIQYNDTPSGGHLAISWKPLVRCKDCVKHGSVSCPMCKKYVFTTADNWYCADGEREET